MNNKTKQTHEEFRKRFTELMISFNAEIWADDEHCINVDFITPGVDSLKDIE